jgi:hypothetical protein
LEQEIIENILRFTYEIQKKAEDKLVIIQNRTGDQATTLPVILTENSYCKPPPMCGGFFYAPNQTIKACPGGTDKSIFVDAIDQQLTPSRLVGTGSYKRGAGGGYIPLMQS